MTPAQFAEFFRLQGHRVAETESCWWYEYRPFVFISIPYHRALSPSSWEMLRVLVGARAAAIRFPAAPDDNRAEVGIFMCSDRNYGWHSLHPKTRTRTRRGLENSVIEQVDFAYLAKRGHQLNLDTYRRHGLDKESITLAQWRRLCEVAARIPDFEAWGAWVGGDLAAFSVTALIEDCLFSYHESSSTQCLQFGVNNALIFTLTGMKLADPRVTSVSLGVRTLTTPGLDEFKSRIGFKVKRFGEGLVFNPLLQPCLRLGGRQIVSWMARRYPERELWRKLSMMIQQKNQLRPQTTS
jgi:hypothetical protein